MKFSVIERSDTVLFNTATDVCARSYWRCKILNEGMTFEDEHPERYFVMRDDNEGAIQCTIGMFSFQLPIDQIMVYDRNPKMISVELGRFGFSGGMHNNSKLVEIIRSLILNTFKYFQKQGSENIDAYVDTHEIIQKVLNFAFRRGGVNLLTPQKFSLIEGNFRPERVQYLEKLRSGKAGLFKVNQEVLKSHL